MRNRGLSLIVLVLLATAFCVAALGQSTPTCTVNIDNPSHSCSGSGWYSGLTSCQHGTITCSTVNGVAIEPLGITFGYTTPSAAAGTIVFFSPAGGTTPSDANGSEEGYAAYYSGQHFQVVQTKWGNGSGTDSNSDWEDTGYSGPGAKNIAYAAGRPAAFLSWVSGNLYAPIHSANHLAGMCAQGNSAGGAAVAYSLAWYGAGSYLDQAEFLSSPPLSDLEQGCENALGQYEMVTVCPAGEFGCNPANNPTSWTLNPYYGDALNLVRQWSDDTSLGMGGVCRQGGMGTSAQANAEWKAMSIVDGNVGVFSYPQTSMTAWLCSSNGVYPYEMNNSSTEAELFFQNFTGSSQVFSLLINGVVACNGVEDVTNADPPQGAAIEQDMISKCVSNH